MKEWSCTSSLVSSGGTINFNATSGDRYLLIPNACSWTLDTRVTVDSNPQSAGGVIFPSLDGPAHLVLVGLLLPSSDSASARNDMYDSLEAVVNGCLAANGTFSQTPTGDSARSLAVRREVALTATSWNAEFRKQFVFGLIAADPVWT